MTNAYMQVFTERIYTQKETCNGYKSDISQRKFGHRFDTPIIPYKNYNVKRPIKNYSRKKGI